MLAAAHQFQLNLILNVLDVQRASRGHAALKGRNDLRSQVGNRFVNAAAGGCGATFHSQKSFGNRNRDFAVLKGDHGAVAFDDPQLARRSGGQSCRVGVFSSRSWSGRDAFLFY